LGPTKSSRMVAGVAPAAEGQSSGFRGPPLITFSLSFEALQQFVETTNSNFTQHDRRIGILEKQVAMTTTRNVELERMLQDRADEILVLRGEVSTLTTRVTETEEQNKALREENALAFTKIHKKLESSATSEGLQKEMMSLKEGSDNRMLVLENMMRDVGGDKMKALIADVASLQHDSIALWKENARMILEIEQRAHVDQVRELRLSLNKTNKSIEEIQDYTNTSAQERRQQAFEALKVQIAECLKEAEASSKLVRAAVERTDRALMAKKETDGFIDRLREELGTQSKGLTEAQNLVRALLGAQKRFAVELDEVVSKGTRNNMSSSKNFNPDSSMSMSSKLDSEAARIMAHQSQLGGGTVTFALSDDKETLPEDGAPSSLGFYAGSGQQMPSFPPGRVRRPQSAAPLLSARDRGGGSCDTGSCKKPPASMRTGQQLPVLGLCPLRQRGQAQRSTSRSKGLNQLGHGGEATAQQTDHHRPQDSACLPPPSAHSPRPAETRSTPSRLERHCRMAPARTPRPRNCTPCPRIC